MLHRVFPFLTETFLIYVSILFAFITVLRSGFHGCVPTEVFTLLAENSEINSLKIAGCSSDNGGVVGEVTLVAPTFKGV